MGSLLIRNLPEAVRRGLRLRAARRGSSMEAEARAILTEAVRAESGRPFDAAALQEYVAGLFRGRRLRLTQALIRERRREARREARE